MSRQQKDSNSAHHRAVKSLADARQHVRKYRFDLERANVPDDQIFVSSTRPNHPQKNAHAAVLDYWEEVAQPEYTVMMDKLWTETLTDAAGHEIEVTVPKDDLVTKTLTERTGIENMAPELADIDTKQETVALESLGHKWAGRTITVRATIDSPYHEADEKTQQVRLWMPPKLVKAAYSQLNSCLGKIGLLAKTRAPIENDPDPI